MTRQTTEPGHIHVSDAKLGDVLITLTYPHGGGDTRAALRVEDSMSGEMLVEIDLNPEQFLRVMASGATRVHGAQLPRHPERIGSRMQNTSTNIGHSVDDKDAEAERVRAQYLAEGWERVRIDRTNFGRRVVAYRWIADEPESALPDDTTKE